MNAAFEDCLVLDELYDLYKGDHTKILPKYSELRVDSTHALCDLSLNNFIEMRSHTAHSTFLFKKKIEALLHKIAPNSWIPLYTMVAFTRTPYHEAKQRAAVQDR